MLLHCACTVTACPRCGRNISLSALLQPGLMLELVLNSWGQQGGNHVMVHSGAADLGKLPLALPARNYNTSPIYSLFLH